VKSLYLKIVLATVVILALSVVVFQVITQSMIANYFNPVFDGMDEVSVQEADEMLETSGPDSVATYMHRLDSVFGGKHYLLDSVGKNVLTGEDLSGTLPEAPFTKLRGEKSGRHVIAHRSKDGRYWFVVVSPLVPINAPLYRYYLLLAGASILLSWLGAVYVVSPLRRTAATIRRFGDGDLSVRLHVQRQDEIGTLATAFNSMADRIQTLFESEQRLLADVSHELRSPLARLHFSVKLARTAADREVALDRVKRDVDRLSTLVASLLEMARAEGSPEGYELEEVDLSELIAETIRDGSLEAEARGTRIHVSGQPGIKVFGNPELLHRAVENVLRNAIQHSPENSTIDVNLALRQQTVSIAIRDYGRGILEEFLERIFDSFFRTQEARDSQSGGVGLGLAIAKRAVHIHGGSIGACNANPGLRVEIELPLTTSTHQNSDTVRSQGMTQN
jgi:signal transduction histidine kinase